MHRFVRMHKTAVNLLDDIVLLGVLLNILIIQMLVLQASLPRVRIKVHWIMHELQAENFAYTRKLN